MLHRCTGLVSLMLVVLSATAESQDRGGLIDASADVGSGTWMIGITGSFAKNYHTGAYISGPWDQWRMMTQPITPDNGSGSGFQIGLVAECMLSSSFSLDMRAAYDVRSANCEDPLAYLPDSSSQEASMLYAFSDIDYRLVTADLMLTTRLLQFSPDVFLALSAGPSFGVVTTATETVGMTRRPPDTRTIYENDRDIAEYNDTRLSLKGGAGIDARMSDRLWTHLRVHYDMGLTDLAETANWQVSSLLFQLDVLYAL